MLLASALLSCEAESHKPAPLAASTDLAKLRTLLDLPPGVVSARWLVLPRRPEGSRLVPGPTDTVLFAYLETAPGFWSEQGARMPIVSGPVATFEENVARQLLPANVLKESTLINGAYRLDKCERRQGPALDGSKGPHVGALSCGSALILIDASN